MKTVEKECLICKIHKENSSGLIKLTIRKDAQGYFADLRKRIN